MFDMNFGAEEERKLDEAFERATNFARKMEEELGKEQMSKLNFMTGLTQDMALDRRSTIDVVDDILETELLEENEKLFAILIVNAMSMVEMGNNPLGKAIAGALQEVFEEQSEIDGLAKEFKKGMSNK